MPEGTGALREVLPKQGTVPAASSAWPCPPSPPPAHGPLLPLQGSSRWRTRSPWCCASPRSCPSSRCRWRSWRSCRGRRWRRPSRPRRPRRRPRGPRRPGSSAGRVAPGGPRDRRYRCQTGPRIQVWPERRRCWAGRPRVGRSCCRSCAGRSPRRCFKRVLEVPEPLESGRRRVPQPPAPSRPYQTRSSTEALGF